jgi:serine/threonine protein kinase
MAGCLADLQPSQRTSIHEQHRFVEAQSADPEVVRRVFLELESLRQAEDVEVRVSFAPEIDRVGALVGRYRVASLLGRGGIGEVYSAHDTDLDRAVALKFLRPEAIGDSGAVKRFVREARAASGLNHPNIVTVHEVIDSTCGLAIVMELVAGQPLNELRGCKLTLPQVLQIGSQVASALATAHEQAIVHRDIKPENLIARPDGVVKVLDFGLAKSFAKETAPTFQSSITGFAGTLRYMSPEQLRHERLTGASDIYSLGLLLYEFIAGRHPFESSYAWEIAHAITLERLSPCWRQTKRHPSG